MNESMKQVGCFLLFMVFCSLSCTRKNSYADGILQLQSRPVSLPLDKMRCMWNGRDTIVGGEEYAKGMKLVVYYDSAACSSCGLKTMYLWDKLIEELESCGKDVSLCFVFAPLKKDMGEFRLAMRTMPPLVPVYVDTVGVFARENPHLPREAMYHTFLLDEENRVVLVGDPSRNERIKELFWQIVEEKSGKCEIR